MMIAELNEVCDFCRARRDRSVKAGRLSVALLFVVANVLLVQSASAQANIDLSTLDGSDGFFLSPSAAVAYSGVDVSNAGDFNDDGFDDVVIGGENCAYIVFGQSAGFPPAFDLLSLNGTNGIRLDVPAGENGGHKVGGGVDVNGDGFDDVLVTAPFAPYSGASSGSCYVAFGKSEFSTSTLDLSSLDGTNGFRIDGIGTSEFLGFDVTGGGDINNDGFDDIIIGVRMNLFVASGLVSSYVLFGKSGFSPVFKLNTLDGTNGFKIIGAPKSPNAPGKYDSKVGSAGDINGDGFDDIMVGVHGAGANGVLQCGVCDVIFGKASGFTASINVTSLNGTNGFRFSSPNQDDEFGWSVSGIGDVNGDGIDDLIVGATERNLSVYGSGYVLFGKTDWATSATVSCATLNGTNGFKVSGFEAAQGVGFDISSLGDFNNDGIDDFIIGALSTHPFSDSAPAFVVFGKTDWSQNATIALTSLDGTNGFKIGLIPTSANFGARVSEAGDFNGDGIDDLIMSGPGLTDNNLPGASYVVFGKSSATVDNWGLYQRVLLVSAQ